MQTVSQATHRARVDPFQTFLTTLQDTGNITASCMVAGIQRTTAYRRKEADAEFREAWDAAIEISVDKLEYVARNRAVDGVREPIYYKGDVVGHVHKPSDRLMELLLKAHRPDKFNPVQKLEHSGGVSVSVMQFGAGNIQDNQPVTIEYPEQGAEVDDEPRHMMSTGSAHDDYDGGAISEGGTPKHAASQNDEPCQVAKFSESEPE